MRELTRLWIVLAGGGRPGLDEMARALGLRRLAAVACAAAPDARAAAAILAAPHAPATEEVAELAGPDRRGILGSLDRLAARHADLEVLVIAERSTLEAALDAALDLRGEPRPSVALRPGALFAFDWPTGRAQGVRPLLIGADLDWLPPWTSGREHARYPGGPGAAGTARG